MNAACLHPGTEVEVNVRGRIFPARITGTPAGHTIPIEPSVRNVSYRRVRASQIKRVLSSPQLQLGGAG